MLGRGDDVDGLRDDVDGLQFYETTLMDCNSIVVGVLYFLFYLLCLDDEKKLMNCNRC